VSWRARLRCRRGGVADDGCRLFTENIATATGRTKIKGTNSMPVIFLLCFVSFRFVSFRFVSFRFVSFRFSKVKVQVKGNGLVCFLVCELGEGDVVMLW
jgi:hypothetical protein